MSAKLKDALWTRYMEMHMEGKTGLIFQSQNGSLKEKEGRYVASLRAQELKTFDTEQEAREFLDANKTPVDPKNVEERWFKAAVNRVPFTASEIDTASPRQQFHDGPPYQSQVDASHDHDFWIMIMMGDISIIISGSWS